MTARDLARRAFWSQHPLCDLYAIANGRWRNGRYEPASSWSLRDLIAFAEQLPKPIIEKIGETS